jgi:hypothetical protein
MIVSLLFCSVFLIMDVLYSIVYFEYTYFLELRKRFGIQKNVPIEQSQKIKLEIKNDLGLFRRLIQALYIPWLVLCCFMNLWYLPVIVTLMIAFTNFIYGKAYISPLILLINLISMCCCFAYGIVSLI